MSKPQPTFVVGSRIPRCHAGCQNVYVARPYEGYGICRLSNKTIGPYCEPAIEEALGRVGEVERLRQERDRIARRLGVTTLGVFAWHGLTAWYLAYPERWRSAPLEPVSTRDRRMAIETAVDLACDARSDFDTQDEALDAAADALEAAGLLPNEARDV